MSLLRDPVVVGPASAIAAAVIAFFLTRRKHAADVVDSLALAAKHEAETDAIKLTTWIAHVEHLERRVSILEKETLALRAQADYLAERVNPAVAAEARGVYDKSLAGVA